MGTVQRYDARCCNYGNVCVAPEAANGCEPLMNPTSLFLLSTVLHSSTSRVRAAAIGCLQLHEVQTYCMYCQAPLPEHVYGLGRLRILLPSTFTLFLSLEVAHQCTCGASAIPHVSKRKPSLNRQWKVLQRVMRSSGLISYSQCHTKNSFKGEYENTGQLSPMAGPPDWFRMQRL